MESHGHHKLRELESRRIFVREKLMAADYDAFARKFKKSRELPFRTCIEEFMMLQMLGNLAGLTALDLACGEGHYARLLRRQGAARVVGVDISGGMITLAKEEEAREPLGIEYLQAAVEDLGVVGAFDVASAVYLLHYAPTREHLAAMCRTLAANLRPGGRLVALNSNFGPGVPADLSRYGWKPSDPTPIEEGKAYRLTFLQGPDSFEIQNYYYSHATYEEVFRQVGFVSMQWHLPVVSPACLQQYGQDYWQEYVDLAPIIGIECRR
jgi:2-polyprenyl-3-methyl-5-hydroxy-6-metoxy-1,4-benzoquinol methylase